MPFPSMVDCLHRTRRRFARPPEPFLADTSGDVISFLTLGSGMAWAESFCVSTAGQNKEVIDAVGQMQITDERAP